MSEQKKVGRKLLAKRKLTYTEIKQRQRMKDKLLKESMGEQGYLPVRLFMHPKQLEALSYIEKRGGSEGMDLIDPTVLSNRIFALIREHITANCNDLRDGEPLKELVDSGDLPPVSMHRIARLDAQMKFTAWSKQNIEDLK